MTDNQIKWNPRYESYAKAHGETPSSMMEADTVKWPGGKMCGFILWMRERKAEYLVLMHGEGTPSSMPIWDQKAWTQFLHDY